MTHGAVASTSADYTSYTVGVLPRAWLVRILRIPNDGLDQDASSRSGYRSYSGSIDSTFECLLDELATVKCLFILRHPDEATLFV